jgi:hypothetical protein
VICIGSHYKTSDAVGISTEHRCFVETYQEKTMSMIKKLVVVSLAAAASTAVAATANAAPGVHGHFGGWHGEYDHDHDYGHYGYGHYGYGHWGYGNYWGYGSYYAELSS